MVNGEWETTKTGDTKVHKDLCASLRLGAFVVPYYAFPLTTAGPTPLKSTGTSLLTPGSCMVTP